MEDTTTQDTSKKLHGYVANLIKVEKRSYSEIKKLLIEKGLTTTEAESTIDSVAKRLLKNRKDKAKKDIKYGALLFFGGIIFTAITYFHATSSPEGGMFFLAWGPVIFGGIALLRGLVNYF